MKGRCIQYFSDRKNGWYGPPFLPEILDQSDPSLQKRRFSIYIQS